MSEMGLYAGLYDQLRRFADRFDRALAQMLAGQPPTTEAARCELAKMLRELGDSKPGRPEMQLIATILKQEIRQAGTEDRNPWVCLASALEDHVPGKEELERLEEIAAAVDRECSSTWARMRGRVG